MRNVSEAVKVNKAVEKILEVFEQEKLTDEEIRDALKTVEVTLGMKPPMLPQPPMQPHCPPMPPQQPMPPHRPPMPPQQPMPPMMPPEGMPPRPGQPKDC